MDRYSPLPLFPAPYPGESLYSVFCRYHQRAGNRTDRETIFQLFGSYKGLLSSLLSPYRLHCCRRWYDLATGIDSRKLMLQNTAFQYYSLFLWYWKKETYQRIAEGCQEPQKSAIFLTRDICRKTFLCYCPDCIKEDRQLYGETYWHMLPQIDGIQYCPRHGCRIAESNIRRQDIQWHLFPANVFLNSESGTVLSEHDPQTKQNYLELAEDSEWMLKNGAAFDGETVQKHMAQKISKRIETRRRQEVSLYHDYILQYLKKLLIGNVTPVFLEEMMSVYRIENFSTGYWRFLLSSYAVRLIEIRCLYGGVKNLYQELLNDKQT